MFWVLMGAGKVFSNVFQEPKLMQMFTYLLVNFLTVIVCFIFSFHPRIQFQRYFGSFLAAAVLVAIPFILWDAWFTKMGVWWFRERYTMGLRLLNLPVEEWLFFICIPFSCVFTWYCLNKFFNLSWADRYNLAVAVTGIAFCVTAAVVFHQQIYPFVTALATAGTLLYLHFIAKVRWLSRATLVYLVLMPGFLLVNGVLTGSGIDNPIVNYNEEELIGLRIFTIPVEDAIYGYTLILLNIYFFELFRKRVTL